jgi:hypothetical protein
MNYHLLSFNRKNQLKSFNASIIGQSHKNLLFFMKITKNKCFSRNSDFDKFANILWLSTVSVQIVKKLVFAFLIHSTCSVLFVWIVEKLKNWCTLPLLNFQSWIPCYFIQISIFKIKSPLLNVLENSAQLKNCFLLLQLSSCVISSKLLGLHNHLLGLIIAL